MLRQIQREQEAEVQAAQALQDDNMLKVRHLAERPCTALLQQHSNLLTITE